jgi:predicted ATPase
MTAPLLLEREDEIAAVDAAVRRVVDGEPCVLLLEGPAGIGKTGLLSEARRRGAAAGLRILAARCGALERAFPFGVVRQLFEPALVDSAAQQRALVGAAAAAREVFDIVVEPGTDNRDPSFAALHGLYWLTANLAADGPLAVVVDDLHWCDGASLRFLAYLARRLDGLPVLVAGSLRPAERPVDVAVLGELAGDASAVSLRPRPLGEAATAELLAARLGGDAGAVDPAFTTACHAATGGNPLLLHELIRALAAEGTRADAAHVGLVANVDPRSAARSVLLRLARLPEAALRIARAAAVLGDGVDLSLVGELADLDEDRRAPAADALVRAEILRDEPLVGFVHPLVRDAIYHDVTSGARAQAHARAARLLADRHAPAEQVAAHLLDVVPHGDPWVVDVTLAAARTAARRGAADSAVEYLRRALAEPPPAPLRTEVLLELGRTELLTSGPDAVEHLQEGYDALVDPGERAAVAQLLGRGLLFTGSAEAAADLARRAAAGLPPGHDDARAGLAALGFWAVVFGAGDPAALRDLEPHRALPVPDRVGAKMLAAVAAQE